VGENVKKEKASIRGQKKQDSALALASKSINEIAPRMVRPKKIKNDTYETFSYSKSYHAMPSLGLQNKRDWYRHSHYCSAAYTSHNRMDGTVFHEWCGDSKTKDAWTNMHFILIFLLSFVHLFMDFCKDVRDKGSCREKNRSNRGAVIIRADSLTHPSSTLEK